MEVILNPKNNLLLILKWIFFGKPFKSGKQHNLQRA